MNHTTPHPLSRFAFAAAALAALTLGLTACGDDEPTAQATTTSHHDGAPTTEGDPGTATEGTLSVAACDAFVELNASFGMTPPPEELAAFGEELSGTTAVLVDELPTELTADAEVIHDAVLAIADGGEADALFAPEGQAAITAVGGAVHEGCEAQAYDVVAADFSFAGLADEVPAGRVSIALANEGTEEHELILVKRAEGSDQTLEEATADGIDGLFSEGGPLAVAFAAPGDTAYTAVDLEPGTYFVICTIPTGGQPDGTPHLEHGMHQTIEVA